MRNAPIAALSNVRSSETRPQQVDLVGHQGDTFVRGLRVRVVCAEGSTPVDVGTWTWLGQIRSDYADKQPEVAATFDITTVDASSVTFSLDEAAMEALTPGGHYVYDVQATTTETPPRTITFIAGSFKLTPEVSRD